MTHTPRIPVVSKLPHYIKPPSEKERGKGDKETK